MNKKVITNLRIDKNDWQQIKIMAAELNMSVNEYVCYLLKDLSAIKAFNNTLRDKKELPVWKLSQTAIKVKGQNLSTDDETIYE